MVIVKKTKDSNDALKAIKKQKEKTNKYLDNLTKKVKMLQKQGYQTKQVAFKF